jgi:hypothetical protein
MNLTAIATTTLTLIAIAAAIVADPAAREILVGAAMGVMMIVSLRHESRRVLAQSEVTCEEARRLHDRISHQI